MQVKRMEKKPQHQKIDNVLGTQNGMYVGHFKLEPDPTFDMDDLREILKAMDIRFGPEKFAELPKKLRRHFIVNDRQGNEYRYGKKPRHLKG